MAGQKQLLQSITLTFTCLWLGHTSTSLGQPIPARPQPKIPAAPQANSELRKEPTALDGPALEDVPTWSKLARAILLTAIPDKYEDLKHWGSTVDVFDGFQVKQRGLDIRMGARRKPVNHGLWYKHSVRFPDPEKNISVVIDNVQSKSPGKFTFVIHIVLRNIQVTGQFENWVLGVKGFNFDVVSDVEVHLHAVCALAIKTQSRPKSFLPDLVLDPSIQGVRLQLADLETQRVGRIGGDVAKEMGNASRLFIQELMHAQEARVLRKANEAFQKKKDSLRIPVSKIW